MSPAGPLFALARQLTNRKVKQRRYLNPISWSSSSVISPSTRR